MSVPSFADQRAAWAQIPVDDVGYLFAAYLLQFSDKDLQTLVADMERIRYGGWRNWNNGWRQALGLDSTSGCRVLDYGCGIGLEALQYAKAGNRVVFADLHSATVDVARRVLALHGYRLEVTGALIGNPPHLVPAFRSGSFDVVHMAGVLHHIPDPYPTVALAHRLLRPGGELRLMLYSAQAWRAAVGTDPPDDPATDPGFARYVGTMDAVGAWADWYDRERLEARFGDLFTVAQVTSLCPDGRYLAATLTPKLQRRKR